MDRIRDLGGNTQTTEHLCSLSRGNKSLPNSIYWMVPRSSALGFKERQNMLTTSASIALGLAFVLVGGINVWLVLEAWSRVKAAQASARMLALHRIGGYVFIALFCVMSFFMIARLRNGGGDASPTVTLHLALAMVLSPLLLSKC